MEDLIKKHFEDLSAGNWDGYRTLLATNVEYEEMPTRQRVRGPDEYISVVKRWKTAFPDLRAIVHDISTAGDRVVAEVEWEGTQRGSLQAPFGTIPATNKQGRVRAALVMKIENGKIRETHHYFDLFTLMTQLGLAPAVTEVAPGSARPVHATKRT